MSALAVSDSTWDAVPFAQMLDAFDRLLMGDDESGWQLRMVQHDAEPFLGLVDELAAEPDACQVVRLAIGSGVTGDDAIDHEGHVVHQHK